MSDKLTVKVKVKLPMKAMGKPARTMGGKR